VTVHPLPVPSTFYPLRNRCVGRRHLVAGASVSRERIMPHTMLGFARTCGKTRLGSIKGRPATVACARGAALNT
jgi:hypothetical protein